MSVELPEAYILSRQMGKELQGKIIANCELRDYQKLQKIGFINKRITDFDKLAGSRVETVTSRGNVIRVEFDNGFNLVLAPEYGGRILYHQRGSVFPEKFHLKLRFSDDTALTVALTGMGVVQALKDDELESSYVYRRDFLSNTSSAMDKRDFTFERFAKDLAGKAVNIKSTIVGKDAVVVGFGNSAFQDILYRAKIHPKRNASSLTENEKHALYEAVKLVVQRRIQLGGKTQFVDFYGKEGSYTPAMGPNMKDSYCSTCGAEVQQLSLGGGQIYYCPKCQN